MSVVAERSIPGGVHVEGVKELTRSAAIRQAPIPKLLVIPLHQHIGESSEPLVEPGERVLRGQLLARANGYLSAPVHASSSGTVVAMERRPVPHPSGMVARTYVIETDGQDEAISATQPLSFLDMSPSELRNVVRAAGIVGMGGAGFPTAIKMNPPPDVSLDTLILNGAECEPYITCDDRLMRERASDIVQGLEILKHAMGVERCLIGIEDNKPEAAEAMREAAGDVAEVVVVPTIYPTGGEGQLVYALTGREIPSHGLPSQIGVVMQNVATTLAVGRAVLYGEPLTSRVVTITGHGVRTPMNVEARIGTPFQDLVDFCGGRSNTDAPVIMGGNMMGFSVNDLAVPAIKTTNCIICPGDEDIQPTPAPKACIRCGACADVCPVHLLPQQLYWHAQAKEMDKVQEYNLFDCIECGCCSHVCPSNLPLVSFYRYAKAEIGAQEREKRRADKARVRHDFHTWRSERDKREKEEARARKKAELKQKQAAAAAADEGADT